MDNFNIISVDISELNPEDFGKALIDNGVDSLKREDIDKIMVLFRENHTKIFLDKITHKVVGYINSSSGSVEFTKGFMENLKWMPTIKPEPVIIYNMDVILEKIKSQGMDSLYDKERQFLKSQSKKM